MVVNLDTFDALRASTIKREVAVVGHYASGLDSPNTRHIDGHNAVDINVRKHTSKRRTAQ
jgi:hypothetical protein